MAESKEREGEGRPRASSKERRDRPRFDLQPPPQKPTLILISDMAIGPTLPPHLQKLADQQQEAEESDEDSYGPAPPRPSAPPPPPSSSSVSIGPTLPPHLQAKLQPAAEEDDDEDDDDSLGPALPPHLLAARQNKLASSSSTAGPSRPTAGPSRPPAGYQAPSPPRRGRYDDDSSDDDVVGPMPVPEGMESAYSGSAVRDFEEREARWAKEREVSTLLYLCPELDRARRSFRYLPRSLQPPPRSWSGLGARTKELVDGIEGS